MISWQQRELNERLPEEFKKRGFYMLGFAPPEFAPMPYGFKNRDKCTEYLSIMEDEYKYVAFKNMAVKTGTIEEQEVIGNMFVKLGSLRREPYPMIELTAFYQGRMYRYVNQCYHFSREMEFARSCEDVQQAIERLMMEATEVVDLWWRSVRTLIVENRWPEEEYITDVNYLQ